MTEISPESGTVPGTPAAPAAPAAPATGQSGTAPAPVAPSTQSPAPVHRTPEEELAHWKDMARKNEERAKENNGAAAKLKRIEDAAKTDLQRAQDERDEARTTAANERAERLRLLAASSHNLGPDFLDFLGGGTEEEINSRAQLLSDLIKAEAAKVSGQQPGGGSPTAEGAARRALNGRPAESLQPGAAPSGQTLPTSNEGWFRTMLPGNR